MTHERFLELVNLYLDREISDEELVSLKQEVEGNQGRMRLFRQYCLMDGAASLSFLSQEEEDAEGEAVAETGLQGVEDGGELLEPHERYSRSQRGNGRRGASRSRGHRKTPTLNQKRSHLRRNAMQAEANGNYSRGARSSRKGSGRRRSREPQHEDYAKVSPFSLGRDKKDLPKSLDHLKDGEKKEGRPTPQAAEDGRGSSKRGKRRGRDKVVNFDRNRQEVLLERDSAEFIMKPGTQIRKKPAQWGLLASAAACFIFAFIALGPVSNSSMFEFDETGDVADVIESTELNTLDELADELNLGSRIDAAGDNLNAAAATLLRDDIKAALATTGQDYYFSDSPLFEDLISAGQKVGTVPAATLLNMRSSQQSSVIGSQFSFDEGFKRQLTNYNFQR